MRLKSIGDRRWLMNLHRLRFFALVLLGTQILAGEGQDSIFTPFNENEGRPAAAIENSKGWECPYRSKNEQVQLRHVEGKGVGYSLGYTTIQVFFSPDNEKCIPLLDLRGHIFDDGKFAANVGLGFRYPSSWVCGMNAYYDYRQTSHFHYNQFTLGLEALGTWIDFRLNGYIPVGKKQSIRKDRHEQELAFKGVNAEMGIHLFKNDKTVLYGAFGPYYLEGNGRNAWGGEARFSVTFLDHVRFEVNGSYDSFFRWIGQGQISLMYFFGNDKQLKHPQKTCYEERVLRDRVSQWIDRYEIIMTKNK